MQIGMNLPVMAPGLDRDTLEALCRVIDEGPFSSLAVGERINFPNPELTVTLSAAAAWTRRVRLLYNVMVLPMHHPVQAAKEVATLDVISGGRVTLAVGVGGREEDYRAVDAVWDKKRLSRMESHVARMRRIWAGEKAHEGALRPVEPFPLQPGGPPVLAGALFHPSIERAARWADGICGFSFSLSASEVSAAFEVARKAWKAAGREAPPRLVTGCWYALGGDGRAQMDAYLDRYLNFLGAGREYVIPTVCTTNEAELKDAIARARDAGADELVLAPTSLDPEQIRRVADIIGG
jgi:alkanesulfonate monooxygenase SsuD/methylene tetrahydromethanopterin reductase-like flavin-dependent oxidoreductase (luciferase family)